MDIGEWVSARGGIVHRADVLEHGVSARALRAAIDGGTLQRVRRFWVATADAPPLLVTAALATARLACASAAAHRGWWMPPHTADRVHLYLAPTAHAPRSPQDASGPVRHWSSPIVPVGPRALVESVPDTLEHIASCLPREDALVLWEDAARAERIDPLALRRVRWRSARARELAQIVTGQMGPGLETIFVSRLARGGVAVRVQVPLAGHDVDVLIGERLVAQLDGFRYHSSSADRTRDIAHDRELIALGYTVLRFSYVEVLHRWQSVERAVLRAIAQGDHLAR